MITAFIDETEVNDVFMMAAWVSNVSTWEAFSEDWQSVLDRSPAIVRFKHSEAMVPNGVFEGWDRDAIDNKITSLVDVICRHPMYGMLAGLRASTYIEAFRSDVITKHQVKSVLKVTHPYHSCFFAIRGAILGAQRKRGIGDKVDFVFDEQVGLFNQCKTIYDDFKHLIPPEFLAIDGTAIERSEDQIAALQAADLLAGQVRQEMLTGIRNSHIERMRLSHEIMRVKAYSSLFPEIPGMVRTLEVAIPFLQEYRKLAKARGWDDLKD